MPANIINFTKSELYNLPLPSAGRIEYNDSKIPGLQLRVTSKGVKTFCVYRWLKSAGKPERVTIGRFPEITVEVARNKASEILAAFALGESPNDAKRKARGEITFGELFELYLERHAMAHKRTWQEDRSKYIQYLCSDKDGINLSSQKLSSIERIHIAQLHAKICKSHPITANRVIALISSIFNRAIEWSLYDKVNPASKIKKFKENSRDRFLQRDELPRFFAALAVEPNDTLQRFFLICLLTGARRGNVLAMRWDGINLKEGIWVIPWEKSKNGAPLKIVLGAEVIEILKQCKQDNDSEWVFPSHGRTGHLAEPKRAWQRLLDNDELTQLTIRLHAAGHKFVRDAEKSLELELGRARDLATRFKIDTNGARLEDFRPHDLRRTLGSYQAITGASLHIIGKSLGHKTQTATQVYARLDLDPVRESVQKATKEILGTSSITVSKKED